MERALPDATVGLTGVLANRYEIEREIGRGGMATVYLACDLRHNSRVAVKVLHPELAAFIGQARFTREIQVTARLQHPNILPIFDSGHTGKFHYYVSPYVEGQSLARRIELERQLPVDDALEIACEVADALAHAHAEGLVHRDIKPANILLAHGHAMIADFGIARFTGPGNEKLTETGMALGTASYMSPEQAAGGVVDARSDIYSLGCVVYEMLAGVPPFSGVNAQAVIARHMLDPVPSLRGVRPTVTPAIEAAIRKAMAKAPADRFSGAAEFRDAIRRARTEMAALVRATMVTSGASHPHRTRRIAATSVAVAAIIIAAGFLVPRMGPFHRSTAELASTADPNWIAVLYFDDDSPDHNMGYLASGLTESLIRELSTVPVLHVISANGVKQFRNRAMSLDSIASALHVGNIVQGTIERSGDNVRVAVDLVDAATGRHLDSHTTERPVTDLFGLEDDVSQQVATLLRTRLGQEVRIRDAQQGTQSVQARELLLRADQARDEADAITTHARGGDVQDALGYLRSADSLLVSAGAADPAWIQPAVARGWVMLDIAKLSSGTAQAQAFRTALENADRALRSAPQDASALELHGTALWRSAVANPNAPNEASVRRAEQDLRTAVSLQPNLATAWSTLSQLLRADRGALAEANDAARRALTEDAYLENAPTVLEQLSQSELLLGDYSAAARSCNEGGHRFPADRAFVDCRLKLMLFDTAMAQNPQLAWDLVARADRLNPPAAAGSAGQPYDPIFRRMAAAAISARAGQRDSARSVMAWAHHQVGSDPDLNTDLEYDEAYVRMALGEKDAALRLLQEHVAARPTMKTYLTRDPLFAGLRSDPRFTAAIQTR